MVDNRFEYGFRWSKANGGSPCPQGSEFSVADAYQATVGGNVDLGVGDPVIRVSDGSVALAAAGGPIFGIITGIERYWDGEREVKGTVVPGGSTGSSNLKRETRVLVTLASHGLWEIMADDNVTQTTEAGYRGLIHSNADISLTRTQINNKWRASPRLDVDTADTSADKQLRIMEVSKSLHNEDFSGANVHLIVAINETGQATQAATTIGGV